MYRRILVVIVDRCHHHLEEKMKKKCLFKRLCFTTWNCEFPLLAKGPLKWTLLRCFFRRSNPFSTNVIGWWWRQCWPPTNQIASSYVRAKIGKRTLLTLKRSVNPTCETPALTISVKKFSIAVRAPPWKDHIIYQLPNHIQVVVLSLLVVCNGVDLLVPCKSGDRTRLTTLGRMLSWTYKCKNNKILKDINLR